MTPERLVRFLIESTYKELERDTDIDRTSWSRYFSGKFSPRLDTLRKVADIYGVTITEFVDAFDIKCAIVQEQEIPARLQHLLPRKEEFDSGSAFSAEEKEMFAAFAEETAGDSDLVFASENERQLYQEFLEEEAQNALDDEACSGTKEEVSGEVTKFDMTELARSYNPEVDGPLGKSKKQQKPRGFPPRGFAH